MTIMEALHTRAPIMEITDRLTAMRVPTTEITDRLTAMGAPITEIMHRLTAMGHPTGAWSSEAIETVMQITTTTDVMQAAEAMQQGEGQEDFAAQPLGPRHRALRIQIIVSDQNRPLI